MTTSLPRSSTRCCTWPPRSSRRRTTRTASRAHAPWPRSTTSPRSARKRRSRPASPSWVATRWWSTAGLHVRIAAPEGHQPEEQYVERAREIGEQTGATAKVMTDPRMAATGADVVVTDTWVSLGKEEEEADRLAAFGPYTVTAELMGLTATDAIVMHCLP